MSDIAVVLTCHGQYLRWLPEAVASIERQRPRADELVLVCDGCAPPALDAGRWRVVEGRWGHASDARNAGLADTSAPWVIFWDADDVMPADYLAAVRTAVRAAPPETAVIYPDLCLCDERLTPLTTRHFPAWDYWELRADNYVSTESAWRRAALEAVGGWSRRAALEDYALALDLTARGWTAMKLDGPPVTVRVHEGSALDTINRRGEMLDESWRVRSLAVVSLLAGRDETFERWERFLMRAELPPLTSLYVLDNSGCAEFTRRAFDACRRIASERALTHLDFSTVGRRYRAAEGEDYLVKTRHLHVARLYADLLPRVTEDVILTLEDDIEAPADAVAELGKELVDRSRGETAVVGAAYAMPHDESLVCAGEGDGGGWGSSVAWRNLPPWPYEVACVGGGCTVWANWALRRFPVHLRWEQLLGWDGVQCLELKRRGYRVVLHGGVRCRHHVHGEVRDAEALTQGAVSG